MYFYWRKFNLLRKLHGENTFLYKDGIRNSRRQKVYKLHRLLWLINWRYKFATQRRQSLQQRRLRTLILCQGLGRSRADVRPTAHCGLCLNKELHYACDLKCRIMATEQMKTNRKRARVINRFCSEPLFYGSTLFRTRRLESSVLFKDWFLAHDLIKFILNICHSCSNAHIRNVIEIL